MERIKIGLVDDHKLLRSALASLIASLGEYDVLFEANNGRELQDLMKVYAPEIILLDFNMPEMNGLETSEWLSREHPEVKVLMLTMFDTELMLIKMLQTGVRGFLKKDIHPKDLSHALQTVHKEGFYYSNYTSNKLAGFFRESGSIPIWEKTLSSPELELMKLACSEFTYKEIALKMGLNPRSIDTLRDGLFEKLDVKSRVGLAMYAIKHGLVTI
jgi:two-component system invasion response regulator UvrY